MGKKKGRSELKPANKGYQDLQNKPRDPDVMMTPRQSQLDARERGYANSKQRVNSDMIFRHPDMKKHTKGYDAITGEIEQRGRPSDNQKGIFVKTPEPEKSHAEILKEKRKNDAKRRAAQNEALYKDRLATKWDRGW